MMIPLLFELAIAGALSFLVCFTLVPLLCRLAVKLGVVDIPDGKIKKHEAITPYLGGVAVYGGFLAGLALVFPIENSLFFLVVGCSLLLLVGLFDDLVALAPWQKFLGQFIASLCFLKGGLFMKESFFHEHWVIAVPISLLWILTIVNGFNLIDVMDGLATTTALGCAVSFFTIALFLGQSNVALLMISLIGALLAFLWYNKPKAQIYLGDAGALFIGGLLSVVPFIFSWSQHNSMGFITPIIVLAIPLVEVATLIIIRTSKGIPFYKPSPDHFCMYLRNKGWSIAQILLFVVAASLILLTVSYAFVFNYMALPGLIAAMAILLGSWYFIVLHQKTPSSMSQGF